MSHPVRTARLRRRYLRRRLAVALVIVGTPVGLVAGGHQAGASGEAAPSAQYVVQPGDTMWSIAQQFHHGRSVSAYVDDLVEANGGAALGVGQVVVLPG